MWTSRYVARSSGASAFYPVLVHRRARLLDASFRPRLATVALASSLGLHLHLVGQRTFTSKLLSNAQHTTKPLARRTLRVLLFGRATAMSTISSTIATPSQCRIRFRLNTQQAIALPNLRLPSSRSIESARTEYSALTPLFQSARFRYSTKTFHSISQGALGTSSATTTYRVSPVKANKMLNGSNHGLFPHAEFHEENLRLRLAKRSRHCRGVGFFRRRKAITASTRPRGYALHC